ncbi:uncharacterized protein N7484_005012 [Penicillium longicatenatum]|uniref:uncharacterized protein n=1 Tax=Penicillium longicatenatum TaxID=1561947 RepID=UPI002547ABBC|nr:uncharacterized protein N7484_005012 [Penicillium longicatenatum]KAJ5651289.1 hypothetical protein N7484_005012 [Penicillium longicatenatum]
MSALFQASPPKLDLASAHSQLFQVPASSSTSSLYSLSISRKRARRETEKLSSKFEFDASINASPLFHADHQYGVDDFSAELDYRPNRYRESFLPPSLNASFDAGAPESSGTSRKRSRRDSCIASPTADDDPTDLPVAARPGWGRTVINVVGKVLDLCWSGAFRGFYAGGGQGYDMDAGSPATATATATFSPNWQRSPEREKESQIFRTPVPGQYPEDDMDRSWVVVPTDSTDPFMDDTASPCVKARRIHQVSSPRRRQAIMPKLSKSSNLSSMRPSTPSRKSAASPRAKEGPGSAEMQRYAARVRRKEREENASIQRLNKQLQAMIREGKEALGTTVEVDDIDMDFDSS